MADRLVCPKCGVPFAAGEVICPRDGTPRPGANDATPLATAPVPTTAPAAVRPVPELGEEPQTEQVDPSELHARFGLPQVSLKPEVTPIRKLPGIPMESQPAVRSNIAPEITPLNTPPVQAPSPPRTSSRGVDGLDKLIGQKVGDYVIEERIGSGGMGVVYRGTQPLIGASVAIKVLKPEAAGDPKQVERLLSEARVVNAIKHRGIVDIFNFAKLADGRHCVVMELLSGNSLEELLAKKKKLPLDEALPLFEDVLDALAAAHKVGVVHRDLKPSNIFIIEQHGRRYAKVLDFGIAKQSTAPGGMVAQTVMTRFMGTPGFVAPEQARALPVGPLTDLYAMGVVMFLTLTGQPPFEAENSYELVRMHVEAQPPRASHYETSLPSTLDALLLSLMAKKPDERPQSAEVVRDKLAKLRRDLSGKNTPLPLEADLNATRIARPLKDVAAAVTEDAPKPSGDSTKLYLAIGAGVLTMGLLFWALLSLVL